MKKRTCIPGYGKYHQNAQAAGEAAMKRGNRDMATYEFGRLAKPNPIGGKRHAVTKNVRGH